MPHRAWIIDSSNAPQRQSNRNLAMCPASNKVGDNVYCCCYCAQIMPDSSSHLERRLWLKVGAHLNANIYVSYIASIDLDLDVMLRVCLQLNINI